VSDEELRALQRQGAERARREALRVGAKLQPQVGDLVLVHEMHDHRGRPWVLSWQGLPCPVLAVIVGTKAWVSGDGENFVAVLPPPWRWQPQAIGSGRRIEVVLPLFSEAEAPCLDERPRCFCGRRAAPSSRRCSTTHNVDRTSLESDRAACKPSWIEGTKARILRMPESFTMQDVYRTGVSDIAMYLALHELVTEGKLEGESPYVARLSSHTLYTYRRKS
jgi:hypothetical protein